MDIKELWKCFNDNLGMLDMLSKNNETIQKEIEQSVANQFGVKEVRMKRISGCTSPTGFCFTNPDADNPWLCLFCKYDASVGEVRE